MYDLRASQEALSVAPCRDLNPGYPAPIRSMSWTTALLTSQQLGAYDSIWMDDTRSVQSEPWALANWPDVMVRVQGL